MEIARITAKGQLTLPKRIRERLQVKPGDSVFFIVQDETMVVRKVGPREDEYLRGIEGVVSEWESPEDERAWRDL